MSPYKLCSKKELRSVYGIPYSPQHIARLEAEGKFPQRVVLGQCRVAWICEQVAEWIKERIAASSPKQKDKTF
jgi:prophage regulatory protein